MQSVYGSSNGVFFKVAVSRAVRLRERSVKNIVENLERRQSKLKENLKENCLVNYLHKLSLLWSTYQYKMFPKYMPV